MFEVVLSLAVSFIVTYFSIPAIITIAKLKKLYDLPDARKVHPNPIASLGGVAIFAGFSLALLFTISFKDYGEFQYILGAALIMFFLGIKDDILVISPLKKFAGQVIAALLIIFKGGVVISNMHGFLGIHEMTQPISMALTFFTIIVIINSFNLIDGVDGLAGSLGLMATLLMGIYFFVAGQPSYALLSLSLAGSLAAFLKYNFQPAKIFMGDTGSLTIGLVCAVLVIRFINIAPVHTEFAIMAAPAIGFSLLLIPLMDTLRVFGLRIINRRSPFSADRNHIHHYLLDTGMSHKQVTCLLIGINIGFILLTYTGRHLGNTLLLGLLAGGYFGLMQLITYLPVPSASNISRNQPEPGTIHMKPVAKVVLPKKAMAE